MAYFNVLWKESILSKIVEKVLIAYENSQIKILLHTLLRWYEASYIYKQWLAYIKRGSSIEDSATYRLISRRAKQLDGHIDRMHWRGKRAIFSSVSYKLFRLFVKERKIHSRQFIILAASSFVIGYSSVAFLDGTGLRDKGLSLILGVLTIAMSLSIKETWKQWYSNSLIYKLYRYIFY